jgi:phage FluMu protein Com
MFPKTTPCPHCGTSEGLTLYIEATAYLTVPNHEAEAMLPDTFFLDTQAQSDRTLARYSDRKGYARLVFFQDDETSISAHCPRCDKVFRMGYTDDATS